MLHFSHDRNHMNEVFVVSRNLNPSSQYSRAGKRATVSAQCAALIDLIHAMLQLGVVSALPDALTKVVEAELPR